MTNDQNTMILYCQGEKKRFIRRLANISSLLPVQMGHWQYFLGSSFVCKWRCSCKIRNIFKSQREFSTSRKCKGPVIWDTVNTIKASVGDYEFSWVYWLAHGFYHLAIDGLYVKWVLYFHHLAIRRPGANWSNICTIRRAEEGWLRGLIVKSRVIATWETMLPIATVSRFLSNTIFNPFSSKRYGEMYFGETKNFRAWWSGFRLFWASDARIIVQHPSRVDLEACIQRLWKNGCTSYWCMWFWWTSNNYRQRISRPFSLISRQRRDAKSGFDAQAIWVWLINSLI